MSERIAQRRAEVRADNRLRRLRRTIAVAVIILLAIGAWLVERSWLVELDEVQLAGTHRVDPEVILDAAALELGTSVLRLDLDGARERVEDLPGVRVAEVSRIGAVTVRITVEERVPVMVARKGSRAVMLDAEGVVMSDRAEPALLTIVVLGSARLPALGERPDPSTPVGAAHAVVSGLTGPLRAEVARVEVRGPDDVDLMLATTRVRFGRADQLDEKFRALGALLEEIGDARVAVIDVRSPARPVVTGRDRPN